MGTGGTLTGAGRRLEANPNLHILAVIPERFPGIEGLKPLGQPGDIVPAILDEGLIDERTEVTSEEARRDVRALDPPRPLRRPLRRLRRGALRLAATGRYRTIVTVLSDTGERYGSTGMWRREAMP